MSAKKICANCIYSKGAATELHCRRFPPVAGQYAFIWPIVPMDGWCGEQKDKEVFVPTFAKNSAFEQEEKDE